MMKKWMALALAVCLCLCCVSCGLVEKASAFATVHDAIEKTRALDSMDCELDMEMTMSMEGMTMTVPVKAAIKAKNTNSKPVAHSTVSTQMLGMDMEIEMYQEGDWAYIRMKGAEYKVNMAAEEAAEYDYTDEAQAMLQDLPEDLFKDVKAQENEDGSATVTVPIPNEVFTTVYKDLLASLNDSADEEGMKVTVKDAVVKITVADGYVTVYDMSFGMDVDVMGMATSYQVKGAVKYINPGADVTVTPMEGYQDFKELSEDTLFNEDLLDEDLLDEDLLDETLDGILDLG